MILDVLVVGAGPAGCAAAIRAAGHGLRVALVERASFPRDLPGEALHPDADQMFAELGLTRAISKAGFLRTPGWIRERAVDRSFVPFEGPSGLRFGYQVWRSKLDSILLARARSLGAMVIEGAGASEALMKDGRVAGLQVGGESWFCRYLIDASGATRWLSRKLRLAVRDFTPRLVARYAYFRGECALGIIPEFREHPCGWTWLARVKTDRCQCVQLSLAANRAMPDPPAPFQGCRFRGADVTWRFVPECAGDGYFLCGDAAAVLDPAASSGVARALVSGLKAADLIVQVTKHGMDSLAAAAVYRQWSANQFAEQARQLAERYAELEAPPAWLPDLEGHFQQLEEFSSISLANAESAVITSS
jgi:flavin-dependent dehydrogenase